MGTMTEIERISQLEQAIESHKAVAVMFTRPDSPDSADLFSRVKRLLRRFPTIPGYHVDVEQHPTAAREFLIYDVPTVMVYAHGSPAAKHVGGFHLQDVRKDLENISAQL
ncbi:MAG: thioredoxin family protein [Spirochaetota bacterium]